MSSQGSTAARARKWPARALLLFLVVTVVTYGLIFLTGDKKPEPRLGIDLQGGTRVTLVPQGEDPSDEQLSQARKILENRVNGMGVSGAEVRTDGDTLVISVPGEDSSEARTLGQTSQLLFRPVADDGQQPDDQFGTVLTEMADRWVENGVITADEANQKLEESKPALEQLGQPADDLKVSAKEPEAPANSIEESERRDQVVDVLREDRQSEDPNAQNAAASLMTCSDAPDPLSGADDPAKPLVACSPDGPMPLAPAPLLDGEEDDEANGKRLTGDMIDTDSQIFGGLDSQSGQIKITFRFKTGEDTPGGETWQRVGEEYAQRQVAITLDSEVLSAPTMQSPTPPGQDSEITGDFSEQEASDLANNLKYGALPLSFTGEDGEAGGTAETVSPTMGMSSLQAGLIAGLVGLVLVAIWSMIYYRGFGVIAVASLLTSGVIIYGALVLLGRWIGYSLDLAGIAGIIIGIGTTADSFVVYFERIKDLIHQGSSFRSAVPRAWKRARATIITGNVVSVIASIVLYFVAVGDVKGFAFTLGLSTLVDILVAFLVTAPMVALLARSKTFQSPKWNGMRLAFRVAERKRTAAAIEAEEDAEAAEAAEEAENSADNAEENAEHSADDADDGSDDGPDDDGDDGDESDLGKEK